MKKTAIKNKNIFSFSFYFLFLIFYLLILFTSNAACSVVDETEIKGLHSISEEELLYLLDIGHGKPIDAETVKSGIKRAFLKGLFEDISVEITDGEKTRAIINVKERDLINNIYIEGEYEISRKIIKDIFPLKEDNVMMCNMLEKALVDLKHELAKRGFPDAAVNAEIELLEEPYRINIVLQVNTGKPEIIKKINIHGAGDEVKSAMELSEGDIYDQLKLKEDLDRIKSQYKKNEHFKPVTGPYTFTGGILDIHVNPGRRLQISIVDNHALSTRTLLKEMPFPQSEAFSDDVVEEAVYRMLSLYHKKGYPFAQIAPVITSKDDILEVNFFIYEGSEVEINKISISGSSFPDENLKEIMSLKEGKIYNPDVIDTDKEILKDFYIALGYRSAEIEEFQTKYDESTKEMDISIRINEGLKTEIESVNITGSNLVPEKDIRTVINIKSGDVYNEVDISDARFRVIDLYNTYGFTKALVSIKRDFIGQKASITFQIDEGTKTLFGKTIITGNFDTKYKVIERELQQKEGMPFDYRIINKERERLYKLGLFTSVYMEALDKYDQKKDVLIKLHEAKAGSIELSFGYAEYEKYRIILDLSYRNLWGMNRQSTLRLEFSSLEKRYTLQYFEPWFMGNPLQFRVFLLGEDRREINIDTRETRYRLTRHNATAGVEKKIGKSLKAELYYDFSLVNTYNVQPDVILSREDTGTLVISGLRPGIVYDTRDNLFYPERGVLAGISTKFTSPIFLSESNFIKAEFFGNVYKKITKGVVFALSLRGGIAQGYLKTNELPIVERFFLGGRTTVRGYEQDTLGPKGSDGNPTGGNVFLMENLEIRTSLSKSIGIVAFLDGGNVWVKINDFNPGDFKFTTGLGFRYNTPVGPLRVDYGHKLNKEKGESSGELHFSIGHAF
ncbi:MAG: outer membrane protein assembly factor BamA [Nitrospirae bacterium RBG_13_39_12]|nr:MAG: outer membrane protein assembly factor BamA [Nitrospirae bacterium RBG_13_39_12]